MRQRFVIIGAGGFAREVLDIFEACQSAGQNMEVLGYLVETQYGQPGSIVNNKKIIGNVNWLKTNSTIVKVISGVGDPLLRKKLVSIASNYETCFGNIIHPSAILSRYVMLGEDVVITAGCILTNQIRIGDHVHINLSCTVGHDCVLKDYATLAPGVNVSGKVTIREGAYLGTGAKILPGITIGKWSVIGAGCVVINDVPPYATVVGVPGRIIKVQNKN